jgi:hypothetical protein
MRYAMSKIIAAFSLPPLEEGCIETTKLAQAKALFERSEFAVSEES